MFDSKKMTDVKIVSAGLPLSVELDTSLVVARGSDCATVPNTGLQVHVDNIVFFPSHVMIPSRFIFSSACTKECGLYQQ